MLEAARSHRRVARASGSGRGTERDSRARRRARRHEARREVLRVGAARHPAAPGARTSRPRQESGRRSCGATRARSEPVSLDTHRRGRRRRCSTRIQSDMLVGGARPARGEQRSRAHHATTIPGADGGRRGRSCTRAGAATGACEAQIKEETKATIRVPARRGVPLGRRADDVPEVRACRRPPRRCGRRRTDVRAFARVDGALACEGVALERDRRATSARRRTSTARRRSATSTRGSIAALAALPHRIHYTLKANSNLGILRAAARAGRRRRRRVGRRALSRAARRVRAEDIIFGGVGKTERELREALEAGVLLINVESEAELRLIDRLAARARERSRASALRVNPEVTRRQLRTTTSRRARRGTSSASRTTRCWTSRASSATLPHVELAGLDMHVGSQLSRVDPYVDGIERLTRLARRRSRRGDRVRSSYLDIGGGLGVSYDDEEPPTSSAFAAIVAAEPCEPTGLS